MRTFGELLVCVTHPRQTLDEAREIMWFAHCHGIEGSVAESCLWCGHYHVRLGQKRLDENKLFWFLTTIAILAFAATGAFIFKSLFWFLMYVFVGYLAVVIGTVWQYHRMQ